MLNRSHSKIIAPLSHIPLLDSLRGIAVLLVLLMHGVHHLPFPTSPLDRVVYLVIEIGWIGVDLFFVLSGFLITSILLKAKQEHFHIYLKVFYARRALRIFPLYYVCLGAILIAIFATTSSLPPLREIATLASYTHNLFLIPSTSILRIFTGHLWSLAIEEHFYIIWPFFVYLLGKRKLLLLCGLGFLGSWALRSVLYFKGFEFPLEQFSPTRFGALFAGAVIALVTQNCDIRPYRKVIASVLLISSTLFISLCIASSTALPTSRLMMTGGFEILAIAMSAVVCLAIISHASSMNHPSPRTTRLQEIGKLSYGMYLIHYPLFIVGFPILNAITKGLPFLLQFLLCLLALSAATIVVAELCYRSFEKRFLELKRHFPYQQR